MFLVSFNFQTVDSISKCSIACLGNLEGSK